MLAIQYAPHIIDHGNKNRITKSEDEDGVENNTNGIVSYTSNDDGGSGGSEGLSNQSLGKFSMSILSTVAKFLTCPTCTC